MLDIDAVRPAEFEPVEDVGVRELDPPRRQRRLALGTDGPHESLWTVRLMATSTRSKRPIYDSVQQGKLTPHRYGRRLLFDRADLRAYVEASS